MKHKQNIVADYFTFSKKQRNAIIILVALIAICFVFRFSYRYFIVEKTVAVDSAFFKQVAALKSADTTRFANNYKPYKKYNNNSNEESDYNKPYEKKEYNNAKGELFAFDPNTATPDEWKRLGIRDKTIGTISNYLSKGGKFRKPEDIKKVYGIFPDQAERLMPYVQIKTTEKNDFNKRNETKVNDKPYAETYTKPTFKPTMIDINTADTTAFISLPFIGSKLASRIVNYREKLGGFYKLEQVGETYGIADSVFQKIKPRLILGNATVKQININTADAATLKSNPYIRWAVANAIFQFRQQHGNYSTVADLKKIMLVDEQTFNKMAPYLTVQ